MPPAAPPFGITICGLEELPGHSTTGATHVLSILDPAHPVPEAFGTFGEHAKLELRFDDVVDELPGVIAPTRADVARILAFGRAMQHEPGAHLLVHCHAGISRSTAAMTLILAQALPAVAAADILAMVHAIREKAWPNLRIIEFGDALLGRAGTLVTATSTLHRHQLERRPHLAEFFQSGGRAREVTAAQP